MTVAVVSGMIAIKNMGNRSADQTLLLLCESGEKNLDSYFDSVEQAVEMVSAYVQSDLDGLDDQKLQAHLDRVNDIFKKMTYKTHGILTYYYRIDPAVSKIAKGFWYVSNEDGFAEHEVTDITQYDTEDTSQLVWFTVPKFERKAVWLPPYITDNLGARVLSYNVPVLFDDTFVGVIGIEIDYSTMAEQVNNITLYDNGYAFINDSEGYIIYHPHITVEEINDDHPKIPDGLLSSSRSVRYSYEGVEKLTVWLPLDNGMRLNVSVPVGEINASWQKWRNEIIIIFAVLLTVVIILILRFAGHITKPLRRLKEAAEEVDGGNYDCELEYNGKDEIGILTKTFKKLIAHLKVYISDLNDLAYADALTSLHNKGAFDICIRKMESQLSAPDSSLEFAICIFDCNDLKKVNDQNGHDKGDIYIKEAAAIICDVFSHSPVFRIGGDEFAAVLIDHDFKKRDELIDLFDSACAGKRTSDVSWEQVDIARGIAVYDPNEDDSVSDVVRRADKLMYENKWMVKSQRKKNQNNG